MPLINLTLALLFAAMSSAEPINDVQVLDLQTAADVVKVKMHAGGLPQGSFFYVFVYKKDPNNFEKLGDIMNKLNRPGDYRLNLDIDDFSPSPSGSAYRAEYVKFELTSLKKK